MDIQNVKAMLARYPRPMLDFTDRSTLIANMSFVHSLMIASEPLLEEAALLADQKFLADYFTQHLAEELHHAEWLAADLDLAGVELVVNWRSARIAGMQYYLVRHVSPQALLGYMAVLECKPMPLDALEVLEMMHGKQLLRTMRYHAEHDIAHSRDLLSFIEHNAASLDLDLISDNIAHTSIMIQDAFADIVHERQHNDLSEASNA